MNNNTAGFESKKMNISSTQYIILRPDTMQFLHRFWFDYVRPSHSMSFWTHQVEIAQKFSTPNECIAESQRISSALLKSGSFLPCTLQETTEKFIVELLSEQS